jgi:hypothetical protein
MATGGPRLIAGAWTAIAAVDAGDPSVNTMKKCRRGGMALSVVSIVLMTLHLRSPQPFPGFRSATSPQPA